MTTRRKVRVVIPTTHGPAEILRIRRIDPRLGRSMMTVGGDFASKDAAYDTFVRKPGGIIEALVGHATFRMEVTMNFATGSSWQLAALFAHILENDGRLAQTGAEEKDSELSDPATLVWATGRIGAGDLSVGDVGHVARKVSHSLPLLREAAGKGIRSLLFVPRNNEADIAPRDRAELEAMGATVFGVDRCFDALALLGYDLKPQASDRVSPVPSWKGNPYPGLYPFSRDMREVFFGRDRAREETLEQLRSNAALGKPFLLIHGRSGAGKSSLVMAGLVDDVMDLATEGGRWTVATARFDSTEIAPLQVLANAIAIAFALEGPERETFCREFARAPVDAISSQLKRRATYLDRATLLLVLDQLEQAQSLRDDGREFAELGDILEQLIASGFVWSIATIRSDRLDSLERSAAFSRLSTSDQSYRLSTPNLFELREIISRPAIMAGYTFAGEGQGNQLVDHLAELALRSPDSLPLLQFLLYRIAQSAGDERRLDAGSLDGPDGFGGALAHYADQTLEQLQAPEETKDSVLASLLRIETSSRAILARTLEADSIDSASDRKSIVSHLIDARLLASDLVDGKARIRIAHEALIHAWPRLRKIAHAKIDLLRQRDRLEYAARQWTMQAHDENLLLRGEKRVVEAENFVKWSDDGFPDVASFVAASRRQQDAESEQARRAEQEKLAMAARQLKLSKSLWRRTLAGIGVAVGLASTAVIFAYRANSSLDMAISSEALGLARLAVDKADSKPLQAMMLGLAAIATAPEGAADEARRTAEGALAQAMATKRTLSILTGHEALIHAAAVSADGHHALTGSADRTAILWDVASGTSKTVLRHPDTVMAVAFTENDGEVVTGSFHGSIRWWKPNGPAEVIKEVRITAAPPDIFERYLVFERAFLKTFGLSHAGFIDDLPDEQRRTIGDAWNASIITLGDASFPKALLEDITVSDIRFSANTRYALVTNLRGIAAVWDLTTGHRVLDLDGKEERDAYEFTDDGRSVRAGRLSFDLPEADIPRKHGIVAAIGSDPSSFYHEEDPALYKPTFSAEIRSDKSVHVVQRLPNPEEFVSKEIPNLQPEEGRIIIDSDMMAISATTLVSKIEARDGQPLAVQDLVTGRQTVLPDVDPDDLLDRPQLSLDGKELTLLLGRLGRAVRIMRFTAGPENWSITLNQDVDPASTTDRRQWMLSDGGSYVAEIWHDDSAEEVLHVVTRRIGGSLEQGRKASLSGIAAERRLVGLSADGAILATANSSRAALHRFDGRPAIALQPGGESSESSVRRIRFAKDGRTALLIGNSEITLYDYASSSLLGRAYIHRGAADASFHPDGLKIAIQPYADQLLSWQPAIIARPIHDLACDHLPYVAGQPYWRGTAENPYGIRTKVETFCASRQTVDRLTQTAGDPAR